MNEVTRQALEARRRSYCLERRFRKAQEFANNASDQVPAGEIRLFRLHSELIRNQLDLREAEEAGDPTTVGFIKPAVAILKAQIEEEEHHISEAVKKQ